MPGGRIRLTTSQTKDVHQLIAMGYERESCMQAVAMVGGTSFGPWLSYLNKESGSTSPEPEPEEEEQQPKAAKASRRGKKAVAAIPEPEAKHAHLFQGLKFVVDVHCEGFDASSALTSKIEAHGGEVKKRVTTTDTVVIFKRGKAKLLETAERLSANVLSPDWVEACIKRGRTEPTEPFLVDPSDADTAEPAMRGAKAKDAATFPCIEPQAVKLLVG